MNHAPIAAPARSTAAAAAKAPHAPTLRSGLAVIDVGSRRIGAGAASIDGGGRSKGDGAPPGLTLPSRAMAGGRPLDGRPRLVGEPHGGGSGSGACASSPGPNGDGAPGFVMGGNGDIAFGREISPSG